MIHFYLISFFITHNKKLLSLLFFNIVFEFSTLSTQSTKYSHPAPITEKKFAESFQALPVTIKRRTSNQSLLPLRLSGKFSVQLYAQNWNYVKLPRLDCFDEIVGMVHNSNMSSSTRLYRFTKKSISRAHFSLIYSTQGGQRHLVQKTRCIVASYCPEYIEKQVCWPQWNNNNWVCISINSIFIEIR